MRVIYPGGFDLFHEAHLVALNIAKRVAGPGGELMVGVNSDEFMRHYKRQPMNTQTRRVLDVESAGIADQVFIWNGPDRQDEQILNSGADVYIAGTDWLGKDLARQLGLHSLAWFDEQAISLMFLRRTPGISTTQLIEKHALG